MSEKMEVPMEAAKLAAMLGAASWTKTQSVMVIVLPNGNKVNIIGGDLYFTETVDAPSPYIVTGTLAEPYEPEKR